MSERKYVVPEGMLKAIRKAVYREFRCVIADPEYKFVCEAAIRWLDEELENLALVGGDTGKAIQILRRMFLAPELSVAEVDAAIPDLLLDAPTHVLIEEANRKIREAYRRGQKSGAK